MLRYERLIHNQRGTKDKGVISKRNSRPSIIANTAQQQLIDQSHSVQGVCLRDLLARRVVKIDVARLPMQYHAGVGHGTDTGEPFACLGDEKLHFDDEMESFFIAASFRAPARVLSAASAFDCPHFAAGSKADCSVWTGTFDEAVFAGRVSEGSSNVRHGFPKLQVPRIYPVGIGVRITLQVEMPQSHS